MFSFSDFDKKTVTGMFEKLEASILKEMSSLTVKVEFIIEEIKKCNNTRENTNSINTDVDEEGFEDFPVGTMEDLEKIESKLGEATHRRKLVSSYNFVVFNFKFLNHLNFEALIKNIHFLSDGNLKKSWCQ